MDTHGTRNPWPVCFKLGYHEDLASCFMGCIYCSYRLLPFFDRYDVSSLQSCRCSYLIWNLDCCFTILVLLHGKRLQKHSLASLYSYDDYSQFPQLSRCFHHFRLRLFQRSNDWRCFQLRLRSYLRERRITWWIYWTNQSWLSKFKNQNWQPKAYSFASKIWT